MEAEAVAAVECEVRANGSARDAACLPFGMVGELRRKLGPIALAVLLLFMGVGIMNIRVSAEFPFAPACCILSLLRLLLRWLAAAPKTPPEPHPLTHPCAPFRQPP